MKYILTILSLVAVPFVTFAQGGKKLSDVIELIIRYLNSILFVLMGLAVVMFVWYIIHYFIKPDTEKKDAGKYVMYSIIGFFVILSVWGLVNILKNTFELGGTAPTYQELNNLFPRGGTVSSPSSSGGAPNPGGTNPDNDPLED